MATFTDIAQVKTHKLYKAAIKTALGKLRAGSPVNFVYVDKFAFDDKERVMVLLDHAPALETQLGKKPTVRGKCSINAADKIVFTPSAGMAIDKVTKLFADAGVPRAVAHPDDKPDAPSREPVAEKLDMKAGWTEIRTWGDEARELIDAFDGLVGVYKGLPEIRPEWADLVKQHEQVKQAMGEMVRVQITNDKQARLDQLVKVTALSKEARKLAAAIRERAAKPAVQKPVVTPVQRPTPVAQAVPVQETSPTDNPKEPPKPVGKPAIGADDLKAYAKQNPPQGAKDPIEKYMVRAARALAGAHSGVTPEHLEKLKQDVLSMYYPKPEPETPKPVRPTKVDAPQIDWRQQVLDVSGGVADLSGFKDTTLLNKIKQIVDDDGANHHGDTLLAGNHGNYKHWRSGDLRIFGSFASGKLTLVGIGRHSGKGNSSYNVDLLLGGTVKATVA